MDAAGIYGVNIFATFNKDKKIISVQVCKCPHTSKLLGYETHLGYGSSRLGSNFLCK